MANNTMLPVDGKFFPGTEPGLVKSEVPQSVSQEEFIALQKGDTGLSGTNTMSTGTLIALAVAAWLLFKR